MTTRETLLLAQAVYEGKAIPGWIDTNQHMNVAYYMLAFDLAVDRFRAQFGITEAYIREQRTSNCGRRVSPWPGAILDAIAAQAAGQGDWGLPDELGQRMQVSNAIVSVAGYT